MNAIVSAKRLHRFFEDPSKLWRKYRKEMSHDMPKKVLEIVKIPNYHLNDDSLQGYTLYEIENYKNTYLGKLLADTDLIIWDEAPMNDRRCFEAFDRSLKDILNAPSSLFEGKSILLGGEFQQTLPVKKRVSKMEVIASCISEFELWSSFKVFTLKENNRLARSEISTEERSLVNSFASWLLDIDDGKVGQPYEEDLENTSWIDIPPNYCVLADEQCLSNLIDFIYDQSILQTPSAITLLQKAIMCPKNKTANTINSKFLNMVLRESTTNVNHDEATPIGNDEAKT
nr:DNA helicase [Tanacetum cinerariifolium]GEX62207.1 DNA helicase [Tanacetum cinerariifolium]